MKKRAVIGLLIFTAFFVLAGCKKEGAVKDAEAVDMTYKVYCLDSRNPVLQSESRTYSSQTAYELIGECVDALSELPEGRYYEAAVQKPLDIERYGYNGETKRADIYFNRAYNELSTEKAVLIRACVVKTLTQFESLIHEVAFYVEGQPMLAKNGLQIVMKAEDYVDSTSADLKNIKEDTLKLYFASTDGTQLAREAILVHYKNTATLESVVMERIIAGPLSDTLNKTCPSDTKLNHISVENRLCTVDLNQRFLETVENQAFAVKIYSVVNSLCELDGVDSVQILIDGKKITTDDGVDISVPLTAEQSLIANPLVPPALTETESKESTHTVGPDSPGAVTGQP